MDFIHIFGTDIFDESACLNGSELCALQCTSLLLH